LDLNQGSQVSFLDDTFGNDNTGYNLAEPSGTTAENGDQFDLEAPEIIGSRQNADYSSEILPAASHLGDREDFIETPAGQVFPPFSQHVSESSPTIPSTYSAATEIQHLNEYANLSNSYAPVQTVEEQIARMPRNLETEVLETYAWIDSYFPFAVEDREIRDIFSDEPFVLPEEALEPESGSPTQ
jgi:hypothetical protein